MLRCRLGTSSVPMSAMVRSPLACEVLCSRPFHTPQNGASKGNIMIICAVCTLGCFTGNQQQLSTVQTIQTADACLSQAMQHVPQKVRQFRDTERIYCVVQARVLALSSDDHCRCSRSELRPFTVVWFNYADALWMAAQPRATK